MYSLDCSHYTESFDTLDELIDDAVSSGICPSCEIIYNGEKTGEILLDLIQL